MSVQAAPRNAHATAVLAVLNDRLGAMATPRHAYEWDDAPTAAANYVAITLSRMFGGNERVGGLASTMWRLTVRAVGSVTNASVLLDVCTQALEEKRITVNDITSSPLRFETETDVVQDDGDQAIYTGLRSFTYSF